MKEDLALQHARALLHRAKQIEPIVTADLQYMVKLTGGTLAGLDNRLKEETSLVRKLLDRTKERPNLPFRSILQKQSQKINDALRYTVIWCEAEYVAQYHEFLILLLASGYQKAKSWNAWLTAGTEQDRGYRGFHLTLYWQEQMLEVQCHTPDSWRLKSELHALYQEIRNPLVVHDRRVELLRKQQDEAHKIPVPYQIERM